MFPQEGEPSWGQTGPLARSLFRNRGTLTLSSETKPGKGACVDSEGARGQGGCVTSEYFSFIDYAKSLCESQQTVEHSSRDGNFSAS